MASQTFKLPFLDIHVTEEDWKRWRRRRAHGPIFGGPCLIVCRYWGKALDTGTDPVAGNRPVLFDAHGMPWQRWLIERAPNGFCRIKSDGFGLYLQRAQHPGDGSKVTLEERRNVRTQLWHLQPTDDGAAFLVGTSTGNYALDGTRKPGNDVQPHLWSAHWAEWQQWLITRLPMSSAG